MIRIFLAVAGLSILSGCASNQQLYHWGNYEQAYYAYEKNPGEVDAYIDALGEIIVTGEEKDKVPPGLYAEYGYVLLVSGRSEEAMANFAKEREKWPESGKLMTLLIDGPTNAAPPSGLQPDPDSARPYEATPSRDASVIDAPLEVEELVIDEQESEQ